MVPEVDGHLVLGRLPRRHETPSQIPFDPQIISQQLSEIVDREADPEQPFPEHLMPKA